MTPSYDEKYVFSLSLARKRTCPKDDALTLQLTPLEGNKIHSVKLQCLKVICTKFQKNWPIFIFFGGTYPGTLRSLTGAKFENTDFFCFLHF